MTRTTCSARAPTRCTSRAISRYSDYRKLVTAENGGAGYPKLADYLRAKFGKKFITVGEKSYAVDSAAATVATQASYAAGGDIAVRMSSRKNDSATCNATLGGQYRYPATGVNVPEYLSAHWTPTRVHYVNRFFVNADKGNDYGTKAAFPSFMYPEEGNRMFPEGPTQPGISAATSGWRTPRWR